MAPDFFGVVHEVALREVSVSSPMILMEFLLAPTVPSAPRPKNRARTGAGDFGGVGGVVVQAGVR